MQDIKILVLYCTNDIAIDIIILNRKMSDYIVAINCVTEKQHCSIIVNINAPTFKHKDSSQSKNFMLCLFCFTQAR